jgi:hypothetical protein
MVAKVVRIRLAVDCCKLEIKLTLTRGEGLEPRDNCTGLYGSYKFYKNIKRGIILLWLKCSAIAGHLGHIILPGLYPGL